MRMLVLFVALTAIVSCRSKSSPNAKEQERCGQAGGTWRLYPNSGKYCHDECNKPEHLMCKRFQSWGCDCGPKHCWNGKKCVPGD